MLRDTLAKLPAADGAATGVMLAGVRRTPGAPSTSIAAAEAAAFLAASPGRPPRGRRCHDPPPAALTRLRLLPPENATVTDNLGDVRSIRIEDEMRTSYLDYAMSVIVARALPDVRDGLKPVHRRTLYTMGEMGLWAISSFRSARRSSAR